MAGPVTITGIQGIPEIKSGDDLGPIIVSAIRAQGLDLSPDDVLIVTQKIVSKAEGCFVDLNDITPSPLAIEWANIGRRTRVTSRWS